MKKSRIEKQKESIEFMIGLYCRKNIKQKKYYVMIVGKFYNMPILD
ncbi:hypothetical protein CFSAN002368_27827 [Clostridium botulinum A1 str. CFSAN002368]|nr:hypothetical protein CFSAN002368_27827 [Clostridium botulinum A1 str. CFSAN002368]